jgi:ketosteroid isomerase-like protein
MAARGPHDDFDAAKAVVIATVAAINSADFDEGARLIDENVEHVTRDGVLHGSERMLGDFAAQLERWEIAYELEDLIDAGDGALVAACKVERRNRESGYLDWKAWPALVLRIHGGKIVFLEGYVDRRKAFDDLGVAPPVAS